MKLKHLLILCALLSDSCSSVSIVVPTTKPCTPAGRLSLGMLCADTISGTTWVLDYDHSIDMIEARPERPDPDNPGQTLPAHGGSVIQTSSDYSKIKTTLDEACRALGNDCTEEMKQTSESMGIVLKYANQIL